MPLVPLLRASALLLLALPAPAAASELFTASGAWLGEGLLATGPEAPLERGRCRVRAEPAPGGGDVAIKGSCAVAAGVSELSLRFLRGEGGTVRAGFWTAATGQTVQFAGTESDGQIVMEAVGPITLEGRSYEARVEVTTPGDGSFSIRQMLRGEGDEAWRLVVDMQYRPAGGQG
ncbi:MAG: hypothetical protein D6801_07865 [Alphaproteobacteria bacterium]|nr:MAG: hypothetical protein D6801_07865 [Alphaproteobacteria bacterium]